MSIPTKKDGFFQQHPEFRHHFILKYQAQIDLNRVNFEAKKYKTAPLQHRDLLEKLFDGLSATMDFAWSSGMASGPPSTQQTEYVPLPDDMNVDDTQVPLSGVDYPWKGEAIPSYDDVPISSGREPIPGSTSRTICLNSQGGSHTSGSNDDTSDVVVHVLQDM
ncbi:hypothetical protein GIB67_030936, partial [Kingdonia uniflora]